MKITQELFKKSVICRSRYFLDRSSICRDSLKLDTCHDLSSLRDSDYSQQHFYSKRLFVYGFCIILIRLRKPKVCVNQFGIGEPIKLLFKGGGKRKNLTLESFIRFSFWNPSLFLQKKEFLLSLLYAFGFYNQAKSLAPTLKILLVFLCETVANQLQQSKGCCGVSHLLGSVHWLVNHVLEAVHWKGEIVTTE